MNIRYAVGLMEEERAQLDALTRKGTLAARKAKRAQILLEHASARRAVQGVSAGGG